MAAVQAWFNARGIYNEGWKKDVARLAESDPAFFEVIQRWLSTSDVAARHDIFCEVVQHALDPIGGPLPDDKLLPRADDAWQSLDMGRDRDQ